MKRLHKACAQSLHEARTKMHKAWRRHMHNVNLLRSKGSHVCSAEQAPRALCGDFRRGDSVARLSSCQPAFLSNLQTPEVKGHSTIDHVSNRSVARFSLAVFGDRLSDLSSCPSSDSAALSRSPSKPGRTAIAVATSTQVLRLARQVTPAILSRLCPFIKQTVGQGTQKMWGLAHDLRR